MRFLQASLLAFFTLVAPADANPIERACNGSDRPAANHRLCACIGGVAHQMLNRSERRRAARFFDDPQLAQDLRTSDRRSDEAFWERYVAFGEAAANRCG